MRYFITYGDNNYSQSRERIGQEARSLGVFDRVVTYSFDDLSPEFRRNPLFNNKRTAGYWCWKPWIMLKTLSEAHEGDIVCYCDCGSTLYPSAEWAKWFRLLEQSDMVFFRIVKRCKQFTKKYMMDFFEPELGPYWGNYYQMGANLYLIKKTPASVKFVEEEMSLFTEQMMRDDTPEELSEEPPCFIAHRYDQSLLTALVYKHLRQGHIRILTNTFEARYKGQAVLATRRTNKGIKSVKQSRGFVKKNIVRPIGNFLRAIDQYYWQRRNKFVITNY